METNAIIALVIASLLFIVIVGYIWMRSKHETRYLEGERV